MRWLAILILTAQCALAAITNTARGTDQSKTAQTTWTTATSFTVTAGCSMVVGLATSNTNSGAQPVSSMTWNNASQALAADNFRTNTNVAATTWSRHNVTGGSGTLTIVFVNSTTPKAVEVRELCGANGTLVLGSITGNVGSGTAVTTPTITCTPNSGADCAWIAVVGAAGPDGDAVPTWTDPNNNGQRLGTTGGSASSNRTVNEGWRVASASETKGVNMTLGVSREWSANLVTYKEPASGTANNRSVTDQILVPLTGDSRLAAHFSTPSEGVLVPLTGNSPLGSHFTAPSDLVLVSDVTSGRGSHFAAPSERGIAADMGSRLAAMSQAVSDVLSASDSGLGRGAHLAGPLEWSLVRDTAGGLAAHFTVPSESVLIRDLGSRLAAMSQAASEAIVAGDQALRVGAHFVAPSDLSFIGDSALRLTGKSVTSSEGVFVSDLPSRLAAMSASFSERVPGNYSTIALGGHLASTADLLFTVEGAPARTGSHFAVSGDALIANRDLTLRLAGLLRATADVGLGADVTSRLGAHLASTTDLSLTVEGAPVRTGNHFVTTGDALIAADLPLRLAGLHIATAEGTPLLEMISRRAALTVACNDMLGTMDAVTATASGGIQHYFKGYTEMCMAMGGDIAQRYLFDLRRGFPVRLGPRLFASAQDQRRFVATTAPRAFAIAPLPRQFAVAAVDRKFLVQREHLL